MAATTATALGDGLLGEVSTRLIIESGVLQGIAVHTGAAIPAPNTTWAEVGIELGGQGLNNRVTILDAGWISARQLLGWDGNIIMDPTMAIYLRIWSALTIPIYLGALSANP